MNSNRIKWFNPKLNIRQKQAVINILRGVSRPTPYIIFGPPGTGKTVTIVEAILQTFSMDKHCRILACTNSNSCADIIASRLLDSGQVTSHDLVRLIASYKFESCPSNLKHVSVAATNEESESWLFHKIVVTTCSTAGIAYRYLKSSTHFTHCFIDEAAQATEPESLIPIGLSAVGFGVVVLCGDPFQLQPICINKVSEKCGLSCSLMARLMKTPLYSRNSTEFEEFGNYNPKFLTKLVYNYRTEQRLISINSKLFYHDELICVNEADEKLLLKMDLNFPLLFHGVKGEDMREMDNPSWFNPMEVCQCVFYLTQLYKCGVSASEVGIISPYRKQIDKIREFLTSLELAECAIATIEEFQGEEKRVIILSTVRCSEENLQYDFKYNLGFIFNAKRFNVATTRAKSLMIIIGDPYLLRLDENWNELLQYCRTNNAYIGCELRDEN